MPRRPQPLVPLAFALGRGLVDAGHRVVCGGRGGVMSAVAEVAVGRAPPKEGTSARDLTYDGPHRR